MQFEEYLSAHSERLKRFALVLCIEPHLAEDVLQEALIRSYRRWDHIGELDHPHAYVRKIIFHELVSWKRKWSRIELRSSLGIDTQIPDRTSETHDYSDLWAAIKRLPTKQRSAVVLCYYENLSNDEMAQIMGCKPVTVRGYLHRALKTLRVDLRSDETRFVATLPKFGAFE